MEGAILLGLASIGYLLNKDKDTKRLETNVQPQVFENSNTSIYDLNNLSDAQKMERSMVNDNFKQTLDSRSSMVSDYNAKTREVQPSSDIVIGLDGNPIDKENFLVNDQGIKVEPFYSGDGPGPIDLTRNPNLDRTNGMTDLNVYGADRATNLYYDQFSENNRYVNGNVFGLADTGDAMDQSRYDPGMYRTNDLPFEQQRISHIDQNSDINRDVGDLFAQRNSIDNTRALSNQKMSFGGRVVSGKGIDERGVEGQVFKNKPDQDYEQGADRWLVTKASVEGDRIRPAQILPETNRQYLNRQDLGTPGSSINNAEEKRPMFKKSDKQQLASDTIRNAFGTDVYTDGDHSQSSYKVYANERDVTAERTYDGNTTYFVSANTVQLQDKMKPSLKETTLNPASPNGFAQQVTISPEQRLFDEVKTSKKETVLFEHVGGARGSTLQSSAQDQYFRADLNPNKEIIAQGRAPTKESTKLVNGMDTINMDIKKIESDYFNHHQTGVDRVYQNIPTDFPCEYTQDKDTLDNDKLAYRIEGDLLDPFKHNPYTQSLHSFAY